MVLIFIVIFFFFLGRLSKDIKFGTQKKHTVETAIKKQTIPQEPMIQKSPTQIQIDLNKDNLDDKKDGTKTILKIENQEKVHGPSVMDYIMTSVMATVLIWLVNTGLEIVNLQTPYIPYFFYFVSEIFAAYPLAIKSPSDLSIGPKAALGATILTFFLYPHLWDFLNMILLVIVMISAGFVTSLLIKNNIFSKQKKY